MNTLFFSKSNFICKNGIFKKDEEIFKLLNNQYVNHIGICSEKAHKVLIDNKIFEIGRTGILDFNNVKIKSLKFLQNEDVSTIVNYCVEESEE